ncbi:MAG: MBL fold metallo-hydrolase [bacterium]
MPVKIPLEDNFADVLAKAQRGLGLSDEELATRSGVSPVALEKIQAGAALEPELKKIASILGLGPLSLLALAQSRYQPADIPEIPGLALFTSAFHEMTVNAFLIWDPETKEAALFDTGADGQPVLDFVEKRGLDLKQIFITHRHTDHIFDLDRLLEKTGAQAWVSELEPLEGAEPFPPGSIFQIGQLGVETRQTSGHAKGGVTYIIRGLHEPVAVVGDSIFAGSMGGGMVSYTEALRNNRERVLTLPDSTIICPGHGPLTTVGEQKQSNPFFAE